MHPDSEVVLVLLECRTDTSWVPALNVHIELCSRAVANWNNGADAFTAQKASSVADARS